MSVEVEKHDRSGYRPEVHPVLVSYFAQEALMDAQIASKLHISRSTLNSWRKKSPELAEALRFGKEQANAEVVMSLYQQALKSKVTSQIFWSANRVPSRWSRNGREVEAQTAAPAGQISYEGLRGLLKGGLRLYTIKRERKSNDGSIGVQVRKGRGDGSS